METISTFLLLVVAVSHALPTNSPPENPPYINPDLFEGDILGISDPHDRNAVPTEDKKWPGGVIPYMIDPDIVEQKDLIEKAMNHYHMYTCVRFVPRKEEEDFVLIFQGRGCYSSVGRKGGGIQVLSLGKGCHYLPTVVHELGHLIGFYHEHSRSDRDDYLIIHWENIQEKMKDQFTKLLPSENLLLDKFDYKSIMLYGETSFSKDWSKTMTAKKEGVRLKDLQLKDGLSYSDIVRVRKLYNCDN